MIFLSNVDILFMLTMLQLTPDLRQVLETIAGKGDIDDELRDLCTECLYEIGYDENYEPTKDGEKRFCRKF
ncbi:hypothetical protein PD716_25120 [Vibrio gigantis]|uniref:hypothetical protein n=1 Tax=Vibrio gigantis TaxID=296199 RepID=UPI002FC66735